MRITNNMILGNYLNNLNSNMEKMSKLEDQVANGKRITKLSDDPTGVISIMESRVKLYRIEQYQKNIDMAETWLNQTETSTLELNEVIQSAYENTVRMANSNMSAEDKSASAELIGQLRDHVLAIGNSQSGDKYIFGGYNTNSKPFSLDASGNILYNGLDLTNDTDPALIAENEQNIEYEIGYSITMEISTPGSKLLEMGEDNIYTVLDNLYNTLKNDGSAEEISEYIDKLQSSQSHILALEAEAGGKMNRLELVSNRYDEDSINYTEFMSNIEDVDEAEAIMNFQMAETVYLAALQVGESIIQPTLVDFLS